MPICWTASNTPLSTPLSFPSSFSQLLNLHHLYEQLTLPWPVSEIQGVQKPICGDRRKPGVHIGTSFLAKLCVFSGGRRKEMFSPPPISKCFCLSVLIMVLLQKSGGLNSNGPECSRTEDDPACLGSLVAMPRPSLEGGCDGLGSCKLHVLMPEEPPILEEVQDAPEEQQMEFKQILKLAGDLNKQTSSRTRTLVDRLNLVETKVASMASSLQKLQEESRLNLNRLEDQFNSLVALLLGILSGCKLPCNESILKMSILGEYTGPLYCPFFTISVVKS